MQGGLAVFGAGQIQNPRLTGFTQMAPDHFGQPCFPMLVHVGAVCHRRPGLCHFQPHRGVLVQRTQQAVHGMHNPQPQLRTSDHFFRSRSQIQGLEGVAFEGPSRGEVGIRLPTLVPSVDFLCQRGAEFHALGQFLLGPRFQRDDNGSCDVQAFRLGERGVQLTGEGCRRGQGFGRGQQNEHGTKFWEMPLTSTS